VNLPCNKVSIPCIVQEEANEEDTPLYKVKKIELNIVKSKKKKDESPSIDSSSL